MIAIIQTMREHRRRLLGLLLGVLASVILGIVVSTTPDRIGPTGITVFFLFVYLFFIVLIELAIQALGTWRRWRLASQSHFWLTLFLAGLPTLLLALSSLRQLEGRDLAIVSVLAASLVFYWLRRHQG